MNKEVKKIVPQLRFPEFVNDGDWVNKPLNSLCKFVRGPFGGALKKEIFVKEGYAVYEQSQAIYNQFEIFRYFITKEKYQELKRFAVASDDIIMSCSGTMGKFAIVPEKFKKGVINQALLKLTVKDNFNVNFIKVSLELPVNQNKLLAQSAGGAIKNVVGVSELKKIEISIPNPAEQQKIAACLSSLDEVITAETEKLDLLQDHKKGLLQQLFPAEGETQPKFRFPEFKEDGDWEQDELGRSLKAESSQIAKSRLNFIDEGYSLFGADGFNGFIDSYSQEKHYIAIVKDGSGVGNLYYCEGKSSVLGTLNYLLSKNEEKYDTKWLYYLLNTISFKPFIKGANIPHIYFKDYSKLLVSYPKPKEQKKIAACLSAADELIEAQTQKIEDLQEHKKGLLQQLFPTLSEL